MSPACPVTPTLDASFAVSRDRPKIYWLPSLYRLTCRQPVALASRRRRLRSTALAGTLCGNMRISQALQSKRRVDIQRYLSFLVRKIEEVLSILQRATPFLQKARALRLIQIGKQFRSNMDWLHCIIAIRRYHAIRAETEANRTD